MRDKPKGGMRLGKSKKVIEPVKLKTGAKLKADRTSTTKAKQKESIGKVVKSKMDVDC
jgi:hypothetical protein